MCATIAQTEAIGKCHLSALHLLLCFVLFDESVLLRNVKFWSSIWELFPGACLFSLRKQPTFGDTTIGFPAKLCLRNERRNSILMTHHYPDLTSACDWLNQISHAAWPIKSTTQIWVKWCIISVEFLPSFLRCHLAGKPVVASPNVGRFLRLLFVQPVSIIAKINISSTRFHWAAGMLGCHETTSEEGVQKFYIDDISLPRFGM